MLDCYSSLEALVFDQYALDEMEDKEMLDLINHDNYDSDDDETEDISMIKRMVEQDGVDPQKPNEMGSTILHTCCHGGRMYAIQYLVEERKVNVESVEDEAQKNTALHCACKGGSLPAVRYLVEHAKANVYARNYKQWTPLHLACFEGHLDIVKYLVENRKTDPRVKAINHANRLYNNVTPLHAASYWFRHDVIEYLLPYSIVDEKALQLIWDAAPSWKTKQALLENYIRNHKPHMVNSFKRYPLHTVLQCPLPSNDAFSGCLDHYGPDCLRTMDNHGQLPLHVALNYAATSTGDSHIAPILIRRLFEMEPRAATIKDPSTGLYPHERAAALAADNKYCGGWFKIMYEMMWENDPDVVLTGRQEAKGVETSRGIKQEEESISKRGNNFWPSCFWFGRGKKRTWQN